MLQSVGILCAGTLLVTGCGVKEAGEEKLRIEQIGEVSDGTSEDVEDSFAEPEKEDIQDSAPTEEAGKAEGSDKAGQGEELLRAQIRHYYGGILSQIIAARQLPDGELDTSALDNGLAAWQITILR